MNIPESRSESTVGSARTKDDERRSSRRTAFPHGFSRGIKSITPFLGRTKHSQPWGEAEEGPQAQAWRPFLPFFPNFPSFPLPYALASSRGGFNGDSCASHAPCVYFDRGQKGRRGCKPNAAQSDSPENRKERLRRANMSQKRQKRRGIVRINNFAHRGRDRVNNNGRKWVRAHARHLPLAPARTRTHVVRATRAEPASDINNAGRWGAVGSKGCAE